ncbi:sigma-70 family RNA polymerase sigma factor, partial [Fundicoccus sp. Sow4_H7]|uniref:sigma-70 family RNA polymerase sigma factor n=1 Tax=Fundicoccus sp. Sow4_H7 TaxID=3438784 RepID=UPI003F900B84
MLEEARRSNEKLVLQLQKSFDPDVFEELFLCYKPLFLKYSTLFYIPFFDTDDFLQEGRITLLKVIDSYDPDKTPYLSSFIQKVYRNQVINLLRESYSLDKENNLNIVGFSGYHTLSKNNDTSADIDGLNIIENKYFLMPYKLFEIREKSSYYLENLSTLERTILYLFLENYSNEDISLMTNIRMDQVQNTFDRLRR